MAKYTAEELDYIRNKSEEILDEYASSKWASNRSFMAEWFKSHASGGIVGSYSQNMGKYAQNANEYQDQLDTGKGTFYVDEVSYDKDGNKNITHRKMFSDEAQYRLKEATANYNELKGRMTMDLFACAAAYKQKLDNRSFWDKFIGFFTGRLFTEQNEYKYIKELIRPYADEDIDIDKTIKDINNPQEVEEENVAPEKEEQKQESAELSQEQANLENQLKENIAAEEIGKTNANKEKESIAVEESKDLAIK